jgi:hypothetical protein
MHGLFFQPPLFSGRPAKHEFYGFLILICYTDLEEIEIAFMRKQIRDPAADSINRQKSTITIKYKKHDG